METILVILGVLNLLVLGFIAKKSSEKAAENDFSDLEKKIIDTLNVIKSENQLHITEEISKITKILGENNNNTVEKITKLEGNINLQILQFKTDLQSNLNTNINDIIKNINERLEATNKNIEDKLTNGFEKANEKYNQISNLIGRNNLESIEKFGVFQTELKDNINNLIKNVNENFENIDKKMENRLTDGFKETTEKHEAIAKVLATNNEEIIAKFGNLQTNLNKDLFEFNENFKTNLNNNLTQNIDKLIKNVNENLESINKKVEDRLTDGFEKTTKTFSSIIERLAKIDEAQKKIETLSTNVVSLQDILTDKKSRGIFGEIQLNQILTSTFGEGQEKLYKTQYLLSNGTIADAAVFAPEPIGTIIIDSKFPLENYKLMIDTSISSEERKKAKSNFKLNMKKHIDDISAKYIIEGETSNQAILFLPAEAIFAEVNAYHQDLIDYSQNKKIWIASPTTLMAVLSTLQVVVKNIKREKYAHIIQEHLTKLSQEFTRYRTRWESLSKDLDKVTKDVKDISVTSNKIGRSFEQISNVKIGEDKLQDSYLMTSEKEAGKNLSEIIEQ